MGKATGLRQLYGAPEGAPFKTDPSMRFLLPQNPRTKTFPRGGRPNYRFWIWEQMGVEVPFALLTPRIIFKSVRCCGHGK